MTVKKSFTRKALSLFLSVALLLACLPLAVFPVSAAPANTAATRTADPITMNDWKNYFLPDSGALSTENAGGIWTDKSVLTDAAIFANAKDIHGHTLGMKSDNSFLVALSAIASNMTINGVTSTPTDTIIVLDMSNSIVNHVSSMASAANKSVQALFAANPNNRVAVVSYNSSSSVLLPLGSYTAGTDGNYLVSSTQRISIANGVTNKANNQPVSGYVTNSAGTYTQAGIIEAIDQLKARTTTTGRLPVVILLTDGEPTIANFDVATLNGTEINLDDFYGDRKPSYAFLTQLTLAYLKQKAFPDMLLYTIGVGNGITDAMMQDVINPGTAMSNQTLRNYWNTFKSLDHTDNSTSNDRMTLAHSNWVVTMSDNLKGLTFDYISKVKNAQGVEVNGYFPATSNNLAQDIENAFDAIVQEIIDKSAYTPTLVQGAKQHSGYISFVDKIGEHMSVTDVKGLVLGNTLFSGADLAQNFTPSGGALGTQTSPSALGTIMMEAVMQRMGITDAAVARKLIDDAYYYRQLYYDPESHVYSNYIGWYADAAGKYLGFWYEGITTPAPANAKSIVKSYGYLGEVNQHAKSDMMFATVQVRYDIATGDETVSFAIPAALIPVITYKVSLDENDALIGLTAEGNTEPLRLVYEVALDTDINSINVKDMVDDAYLNKADHTGKKANVAANGDIYFYTNQYEIAETAGENVYGYNKVNTYSYFRPSHENDRYYYQENTPIYSNTNGTLATAYVAGQKYYHAYETYTKAANGKLEIKQVYHELAPETAAANIANGFIPKGHVRRDYSNPNYDHHDILKATNNTGTLVDVANPFVDISAEATQNDPTHRFVFGATLGNNGRLALTPATGLRIEKAFDGVDNLGGTFTFNISGAVPNGTYTAEKLNANGVASTVNVTFSGNAAAVTLKAGESITVIGLPADTTLSVTEVPSAEYVVRSTDGLLAGQVTTAAGDIKTVTFTNALRGTGNLTISKVITHQLGTGLGVDTAKDFHFSIALVHPEISLAGKTYNTIMAGVPGTVTLGAGGVIPNGITLKHHEQFEILGLPAGTIANVVEDALENYTPKYWVNGSEAASGSVTVTANNTVSVIVANHYAAQPVSPNITLTGDKTLTGNRQWQDGDSFLFKVQKHSNGGWQDLGNQIELKVSTGNAAIGTNDPVAIPFPANILAGESYEQVGTYHYRVVEIAGAEAGMYYDRSVHAFDIKVTDGNFDGQLEISEVTETVNESLPVILSPVSGVYTVDVNFENRFDLGEAPATIEINKTVENLSNSPEASLAGFKFRLTANPANPAGDPLAATYGVAESAATTLAGVTRFNLFYYQEGIYNYTLTEIDDAKSGYGYAADNHAVRIEVNTVGTALVATVYVDNAPLTAPVVFNNTYLPEAEAELTLDFIRKDLQNKALGNDEFSFEIREYGTNTLVATGLSKADGSVVFDNENKLTFTEVGTYFYNVTEKVGEAANVLYDETTYRIEVNVADVIDLTATDPAKSRKLEATYSVVNSGLDEILFINTHIPSSITHAIEGNKQMVGGNNPEALISYPFRQGEFTFVMTEVADEDGTPLDEPLTFEVGNEPDGSFAFPEIAYAEIGAYYYEITEKNAGSTHLGVTYTDAKFLVKVEITLDTVTGELDKEITITADGQPSELLFQNRYAAEEVKLTLEGFKNIDGRDRNDGDIYAFELYNEDGLIETKENAADGSITFSEMTYTAVGEYSYIIKEVIGNKAGITYDTAAMYVTVAVLDDYLGKLYAEVSVADENGAPLDSIAFTNVYTVSGNETVTLNGNKSLTGRALVDGEFAFELYETNSSFNEHVDAIQTVKNEDGKFSFRLEYTAADVGNVYYYVAKESNAGIAINDITYSDAEYHITVKVFDNGEGGIRTETAIVLNGEAVDSLDFVNIYNPPTEPEIPPVEPEIPPIEPEIPPVEPEIPPIEPEIPVSPQTGDNHNLLLWFALLFVSGGGLLGSSIFGKKKKASN